MLPLLRQLVPAADSQSQEAAGRRATLVHAALVWSPGDQPKVDPGDWPQRKYVSRKKAAWHGAAASTHAGLVLSAQQAVSRDVDTSMASKANEKAR